MAFFQLSWASASPPYTQLPTPWALPRYLVRGSGVLKRGREVARARFTSPLEAFGRRSSGFLLFFLFFLFRAWLGFWLWEKRKSGYSFSVLQSFFLLLGSRTFRLLAGYLGIQPPPFTVGELGVGLLWRGRTCVRACTLSTKAQSSIR
ncbi:predicted protein [Plenodomus lingam JN3]|uniref:Predicted protein n=1 Tax=Leptosphaeria maculans (strain JN3 / isolate v23.1.3 / race Av1-4-5-6-7-8) TaxID=985895 RepID=E4ZMU9_LEPMJ|nr:predicted protein [Plenodomus lingam JN3]CBX92552.1 predicted protein [Plenodomus lingam JN3]